MTRGGSVTDVGMDDEGLIVPRRITNPCLESRGRQDLHRELMFNQKIGKSVLNQKTELQRAMENHKEKKTKKELEQKRLETRTPLQMIIDERAKRLETLERRPEDEEGGVGTGEEQQPEPVPEFLEVHAKLRAKMEAK